MRRQLLSEKRGLTLIEICFVMGLVVLVAYLSLSALSPAADKGSTLGLATAVKEEFEASRQLAIKSGQPVALGIPTDGGAAACSLYRLQGWNTPYVKWSGGYEGDYPNTGFAAATWGGPGAGGPAALPPSAKYFNFTQTELLAWLPDDKEDDYIFCYLPDGSLITNNLSTVNGMYTVVIAGNPTFGGALPDGVTISSGNNPWTLMVSPGGGVELVNGTPGTTLPPGTSGGPISNPRPREEFTGESKIYLSEMKVRPNPSGVPGEGICVPGQVVTLEIYAHCPEGDGLFANWTQTPGTVGGLEGSFTYPDQTGSPLPNEADRMEFIPPNCIPTDPALAPVWNGGEAPAPGTGIWRAKWTWTVPVNSQEGELYNVTANVQNAEADATIVTSPLPQIQMNPAPQGRMIVERRVNGIWQLWRMNPDGSGEKLISPEGVQEMMPTLDKNGTQMALIREGPGGMADRYIVVRSIDGGLEKIIAGPGEFTTVSMSPTGEWVAYRNNATNQLLCTRANGSGTFALNQVWGGSGVSVKKGRSGWSQDGKYVLYAHERAIGDPVIYSFPMPGYGLPTPPDPEGYRLWGPYPSTGPGLLARMFCPTSYEYNGREFVAVSCSGEDSFILSFEVVGRNYTVNHNLPNMDWRVPPLSNRRIQENPPSTASTNRDQDYPAISFEGTGTTPKLVYTSSPANTGYITGEDTEGQVIYMLPNIDANGVFSGPPLQMNFTDARRAIFIPPGE